MDLFDTAFISLWKSLNENRVRYILVGELASFLHGHERLTGVMDLYIKDTEDNRKKFRKAYADYGMGDYESIETIEFVPGWVDFPLQNGIRLDIQTALKGIEQTFDECLQIAPIFTIYGVQVPFLHINHLLANKKAVGRPKDQMDVFELERIKKLREEKGV